MTTIKGIRIREVPTPHFFPPPSYVASKIHPTLIRIWSQGTPTPRLRTRRNEKAEALRFIMNEHTVLVKFIMKFMKLLRKQIA